MARNLKQQIRKEKSIEERYNAMCLQYPHWKEDYILQKIADDFFISKRTVYAVVSGEYERNRAKRAPKRKTRVIVLVHV